ncbi:MAG: hypothetical protein NUV72_01120 [Bauldia sp.]|nr:hypothetical protein [Bauldia sp.]
MRIAPAFVGLIGAAAAVVVGYVGYVGAVIPGGLIAPKASG